MLGPLFTSNDYEIFFTPVSSFLLALHRKEMQELQNLYKQNIEHAAQQAELIQQLQALNMDTQKVLKTQEDAHTAETLSYQKVCINPPLPVYFLLCCMFDTVRI